MRAPGPTRRRGVRSLVAVVVTGLVSSLLLGPLAPATASGTRPEEPTEEPSADAGADGATPLTVRLEALAPAVVRPRGDLELSGTVRNDSAEVWTDVNVAPFVGDVPLTSRAELALAADTTEETAVGSRLDTPGTFVGVGDLVPGEQLDFRLTVPRDELPPATAPGVYWIGAHALGTSTAGRDSVADGRARTFVPVLPQAEGGEGAAGDDAGPGTVSPTPTRPEQASEDQAQEQADVVPVSLVLPLRQPALRGSDGSLLEPGRWVATSSVDGRLDRISRFAATADDRPLGWLLDPGVLDALDDLGQGNPPLSLGPRERVSGPSEADEADGADEASPSAGSSAPTAPAETADPTGPTDPADDPSSDPPASASTAPEPDAETSPGAQRPGSDDPDVTDALGDAGVPDRAAAAAARALLERLLGQLGEASVLALPYGDTDAMGLARRAPALLGAAVEQSAATLDVRGLSGRPVLAPPSGRVDPSVLDRVPDDVGLVASDRGDLDGPVGGQVDGRDLLLADARVGSGGPEPTPALDPLALRQRLVAESWLESTTARQAGADPRPVVVVLPRSWDPGADWAAADFFDALDVPWLRWEPPPTGTEAVDPATLSYPRAVREREVGPSAVAGARELARTGRVLDDLLANDNDVLPRLTGAALQTVSYSARFRPGRALGSANGLTRTVDDDLARVSILGTDFFTLSSGSGTVTVTVVNGLEQPVTVGIGARADTGVAVDPVDPLALGPEQRGTVRIPISSDEGVHDVTLVPVTASGAPAGSPFEFVLRTSQVGRTVWVVMAAGAALFLVTLLRRLQQRLRSGGGLRTRATQAEEVR